MIVVFVTLYAYHFVTTLLCQGNDIVFDDSISHWMCHSWQRQWNVGRSLEYLDSTEEYTFHSSAMAIYLLAVFLYNLFAVLVTFLLSSIWHSILDNFRPMTVWMTDLCIYYIVTNHKFGEPWNTYSWIQLVGMIVLITGTMIYNAPDSGSLLLKGQWYCCGIDFTQEYNQVQAQRFFGIMGSYPSMRRFVLSTRSLHGKRVQSSVTSDSLSQRQSWTGATSRLWFSIVDP